MADFDVIVVGAGIAGSTAAYKLASEGAEVLLVERASEPGAKNLSGGIFYGRVLSDMIPRFYEEAPFERKIVRNIVTFLEEGRAFSIDYSDRSFTGAAGPDDARPANGISVLRARFDPWLAEQAESVGASLVPGIRVDSPLMEDGVCRGVVAAGEEMTADCVIVADSINSKMTEALGQRHGFDIHDMGVGAKYVYQLDEQTINSRFKCASDEGVAYGIMGDCTEGVPGGGFLYTNKDTVSVGVVVHIDHLAESSKTPYELLDHMVANPEIEAMLEGGKLVEYGAHMVAEGGRRNLPANLYGDGWLIVGDAAGFASNNGFNVRGMDFAAMSGLLAAETALEAKAKGAWSRDVLSVYRPKVDSSFIGKDMATYSGAPAFMKDGRVYTKLVGLMCGMFGDLYKQDGTPKKNLLPTAAAALKASGLKFSQVGKLGFKAVKSL